jgi:hypothetical protein
MNGLDGHTKADSFGSQSLTESAVVSMLNNVDEPEAGLQFNDDDRNPQVYDELCR